MRRHSWRKCLWIACLTGISIAAHTNEKQTVSIPASSPSQTIDVLPNGDFKAVAPRPESAKTLSERFPQGWGGSHASLRPDGKIEITNYGFLSRYLALPADAKRYLLKIEVRAKGPDGEKIRIITKMKKEKVKWCELSPEAQTFQYTTEVAPFESGLFLTTSQTKEPVVIESVRSSLVEQKAESPVQPAKK